MCELKIQKTHFCKYRNALYFLFAVYDKRYRRLADVEQIAEEDLRYSFFMVQAINFFIAFGAGFKGVDLYFFVVDFIAVIAHDDNFAGIIGVSHLYFPCLDTAFTAGLYKQNSASALPQIWFKNVGESSVFIFITSFFILLLWM